MFYGIGWSRGDVGSRLRIYDHEIVVDSYQEQEIFLFPKRPDRLLAHQASYSLGMVCDSDLWSVMGTDGFSPGKVKVSRKEASHCLG